MVKALVTSGCSFSEHYSKVGTVSCWPGVMSERFEFEFQAHLGMGGCGNDIIARKAIYGCKQALETHQPDDIMLIVMWSGLARKAFLTDNRNNIVKAIDVKEVMNHPMQGSTLDNVELGRNVPAWVWFNPGTELYGPQRWYLLYDNDYQQLESTLWNMLAVQSFCAQHNIKYFWMTMNNDMEETMGRLDKTVQNLHSDYLFELLDKTNRIHPIGMYEWTLWNRMKGFQEDGFHPTVESHKKFVEQVMLPFFEQNNIRLTKKNA